MGGRGKRKKREEASDREEVIKGADKGWNKRRVEGKTWKVEGVKWRIK